MTRNQQLEYCQVCKKRGFNPQFGLVCGLTNEKPAFENNCLDYEKDAVLERRATDPHLKSNSNKKTNGQHLIITAIILLVIRFFIHLALIQ